MNVQKFNWVFAVEEIPIGKDFFYNKTEQIISILITWGGVHLLRFPDLKGSD